MSAQDVEAMVRAVYDAYNRNDFEAAVALHGADTETVVVPTGQVLPGHDGVRQYMGSWATAFPGSRVEVRNVVASDDGAVVEFVGRGVHGGPLQTPAGTIPPTGRTVEIPFCDVWRVRDGKLAGSHVYFDVLTILGQLGVAPGQSATIDVSGATIGQPAGAA
jgi:steroid delta-isomerase-like uncharacterized protein